ncbi:hypothetical protein ACT3TZ_14645 [Brachybacterium sp. AOP25-B2-12]|uniref:hypothetical protein n=1 Tax=Brachybacterium sp. AOP25-B2-12 TaxID=3457710 RepID=UPI004034A8DC
MSAKKRQRAPWESLVAPPPEDTPAENLGPMLPDLDTATPGTGQGGDEPPLTPPAATLPPQVKPQSGSPRSRSLSQFNTRLPADLIARMTAEVRAYEDQGYRRTRQDIVTDALVAYYAAQDQDGDETR